MRKLLIIFLLVSSFTTLFGQTKKIESNNEVNFKIKNSGINVNGTFKGVAGTISFDPANYTKASFSVSIETKTINTGINARDNHLRKKEYFDAETFPRITFQSTKIEKTTSGYLATGTLTIKGKSREIKIPFQYSQKGDEGVFTGNFSLNRLDYTVGESSWILSDDVTVTLNIKVKAI